jgi:hypothetical protein
MEEKIYLSYVSSKIEIKTSFLQTIPKGDHNLH